MSHFPSILHLCILSFKVTKVPTIAIERVYVWDNTSVIVDEVLSHRLGLIPLNVDPALMQFKARTFFFFLVLSIQLYL